VLLLWRLDAARNEVLRLLLGHKNAMRIRRALLLAAGAILLPAVAAGQT
jgi:hypothetical protein